MKSEIFPTDRDLHEIRFLHSAELRAYQLMRRFVTRREARNVRDWNGEYSFKTCRQWHGFRRRIYVSMFGNVRTRFFRQCTVFHPATYPRPPDGDKIIAVKLWAKNDRNFLRARCIPLHQTRLMNRLLNVAAIGAVASVAFAIAAPIVVLMLGRI